MISLEKPDNFESEFDIVGILIQYKDTFLLLKRALHKPEGGTWGAPGGKVNLNGETLEAAIIRETGEETGIELKPDNLRYFKPFCVIHEGNQFMYHLYSYVLTEKPTVIREIGVDGKYAHDAVDWFTADQALGLNLIHDMAFCIETFTHSMDQ